MNGLITIQILQTANSLAISDGLGKVLKSPVDAVFAVAWPRLVGSLKLQVSFAEYSLFYRALLQKRPIFQNMEENDV